MMQDGSILAQTKPIESRHLPARFDLPHAVAFYLHDALASLASELGRSGALSVHIDFKEEERASLAALEGEGLWKWLAEHGRQEVIADLSYRQLTAAVIADACQFLCESLLASGKGKTTVAFSLLRKPLKENLLLLEWLAAEPVGFLERFNGESDAGYVLNRLPAAERQRIIANAVTAVGSVTVDAELLWLIRYDKTSPNSLETLWTKATHLVTTVQASSTETGNLNFVFSSEANVEEQWEHYYRIVPLVLFYFVRVAELVAERFVEWDDVIRPTVLLLRDVAFIRYAESAEGPDAMRQKSKSVAELLKDLSFVCGKCKKEQAADPVHVDHLWLRYEMICPACGHATSLWDLLAPEDLPAGT